MPLDPAQPLRTFGLVAVLVLAWVGIVGVGTIEGWAHTPLAPRGDLDAFLAAADARLEAACAGNGVLVHLRAGRIDHVSSCSLGEPVDADSVFQVASLGKWISAWGVMTLVEDGRLDLDAPVDGLLARWRLPPSDFDPEGVTVRRLLSHTAGLTDGLGYDGFGPGERVQSIEESLTRAADAMPGASGIVRVGIEPGSRWQYSGGGYTLLQLLVEEVTGESFAAYVQRAVLDPLGMSHSTFDARRAAELPLAPVYDETGRAGSPRRFTALAAASLFTSAHDLSRFLQAHLPGANGESIGRGVLSPATVAQMAEPQASRFGRDIWGLGLILYARSRGPDGACGGFVIGHDGQNAPALNTAARLDPTSGDGLIVLQSGSPGLATQLASEWVFWETGRPDVFMLLDDLGRAPWIVAAGSLLIVAAAAAIRVLPRLRANRAETARARRVRRAGAARSRVPGRRGS